MPANIKDGCEKEICKNKYYLAILFKKYFPQIIKL